MEQRYEAVMAVLRDGEPIVEVAARVGVSRQSLHAWIARCGGFRPASPNYCGEEAIANCVAAVSDQPVELTNDGVLRARTLAGLAGRDLTLALRSYVARARQG